MKSITRLGAVAAVALGFGCLQSIQSNAADFGGDCCADLEERVAELEATTVRKGNRKVSLQISGWVSEQISYWDDGGEDNVYIHGLGETISTNFKFSGKARIAPDWEAGYVLHIETQSNDPLLDLDQDNDDGGSGLSIYQSKWFIRSRTLGQISVGQLSQASDNAAILADSSGSLLQANWVIYDGAGFFANSNSARIALPGGDSVRYSDVAYCHHIGAGIGGDCNGRPTDAIRYDTPDFFGFSLSASYGEDDFWDVAGRYATEGYGFRFAVSAAYSQMTDDNARPAAVAGGGVDSSFIQVGAYLQHLPSGLFIYGAYGYEENDFTYSLANAGLVAAPDGEQFYVKGGIRTRLSPMGSTVVYGEYGQHNDQISDRLLDVGITSSELNRWGVGIVQEIDNAAMSIWLKYRNMEGDYAGPAVGSTSLDDINFVTFGGLIAF